MIQPQHDMLRCPTDATRRHICLSVKEVGEGGRSGWDCRSQGERERRGREKEGGIWK